MDVSIKLDSKSATELKKQPEIQKRAVVKGLRDGLFFIEGKVKERFDTPNNLRVQTGHLRRSIYTRVEERGELVIGIIGTPIIYGAIHEFGGLAGPGRRIRIPARPYIGPEVKNSEMKVSELIQSNIVKELNK